MTPTMECWLRGVGEETNEGVARELFLKTLGCKFGLKGWTKERLKAQREECACYV